MCQQKSFRQLNEKYLILERAKPRVFVEATVDELQLNMLWS